MNICSETRLGELMTKDEEQRRHKRSLPDKPGNVVRKLLPASSHDRRVQRTRKLLHEALLSLLHEKSYDEIVVQEILDRANVGRSTFYTHFRDKDDLLIGGIRDLLLSIPTQIPSTSPREGDEILWFSRPILEHVDQHRRSSRLRIGRAGQILLHKHLQRVLEELIAKRLKRDLKARTKPSKPLPPDLLVHHVASTFVLVLNWWIDRNTVLSATEADGLFRQLIGPAFD